MEKMIFVINRGKMFTSGLMEIKYKGKRYKNELEK